MGRAMFCRCRNLHLEKPDTVLSAGGVLHDGWRVQHDGTGELSAFRPNQPYETEFLSGCAILASRDALARTGLLDEEFFLYYEDVEWSYRARQRGVTLLVAPQALVASGHTAPRCQFAACFVLRYAQRFCFCPQTWVGLADAAGAVVLSCSHDGELDCATTLAA